MITLPRVWSSTESPCWGEFYGVCIKSAILMHVYIIIEHKIMVSAGSRGTGRSALVPKPGTLVKVPASGTTQLVPIQVSNYFYSTAYLFSSQV